NSRRSLPSPQWKRGKGSLRGQGKVSSGRAAGRHVERFLALRVVPARNLVLLGPTAARRTFIAVSDLVLHPGGDETVLAPNGAILAGGGRQREFSVRVGLSARANARFDFPRFGNGLEADDGVGQRLAVQCYLARNGGEPRLGIFAAKRQQKRAAN